MQTSSARYPVQPSFPRPPGERTLQNWSPARSEKRGEGTEAGASSQGPGQKSSTLGASLRWGLLRPSARSCLGEGLTRPRAPVGSEGG